jgi:hypothetical protein
VTLSIRCKVNHRARGAHAPGVLRSSADRKSRCPGWASDEALQRRLLDEALDDPDGGVDSFGRPKRKWNAVGGVVFLAVSTNEEQPHYNCYPECPATTLADELERRAQRSKDELLEEAS